MFLTWESIAWRKHREYQNNGYVVFKSNLHGSARKEGADELGVWGGGGNWKGCTAGRAGILKLLRSTGIDSKESIPPAYEAWRAGTVALFLLDF